MEYRTRQQEIEALKALTPREIGIMAVLAVLRDAMACDRAELSAVGPDPDASFYG